MPQDTLWLWISNEPKFYDDKIGMFDAWIEAGDSWSEKKGKVEALALVSHIAKAVEAMPFTEGKYTKAEIREAADEMVKEFEEYREEAIKAAVKQATRVAKPEELMMDAGDIEHAKKYEALAQKLGVEGLKKLIPASPEKIRKALSSGDKYLNSIPLRKWDAAGLSIEGTGLSLAEKVSVLKHVAKWHYA